MHFKFLREWILTFKKNPNTYSNLFYSADLPTFENLTPSKRWTWSTYVRGNYVTKNGALLEFSMSGYSRE